LDQQGGDLRLELGKLIDLGVLVLKTTDICAPD